MISGLDKYYQIARCFRDEDLRADRQPEFTQLDIEMSFANEEMVFRMMEGVLQKVFSLVETEFPEKFPRMTYREAMRRFGVDKPDLRFGMELIDLSENLRETDFAPFASVLENKGEIKAIVAKGKADYSRKNLDELQEFVKRYGAVALGVDKTRRRNDFFAFESFRRRKNCAISRNCRSRKRRYCFNCRGQKIGRRGFARRTQKRNCQTRKSDSERRL